MAPTIRVYTTAVCPYCVRAKAVLRRNQLDFVEIDVSNPADRQALVEQTGRRTVPQIFIGETHVGGCDDLMALEASGGLRQLTAAHD